MTATPGGTVQRDRWGLKIVTNQQIRLFALIFWRNYGNFFFVMLLPEVTVPSFRIRFRETLHSKRSDPDPVQN
jgi:hypothetical protein